MTHRLYDETCLERWQRIRREEAEAAISRIHRREERRIKHEESSRRPSKHRPTYRPDETPSPRRDDDPAPNLSIPISTWSDPSPTIDPNPSTIDPGGGSSGGGGADGTY
jgi:hypothetical protein